MKKNFFHDFNDFLAEFLNLSPAIFYDSLKAHTQSIIERSKREKKFWLEEAHRIENYSRKQAVNELIKSLKIYEKLAHIQAFIEGITQ